ncbi:MAG: Pr2TM family membrane protein [Flavobacteriaceae bacterium]|nr:2TM domain-containing protein [Bacteroidia bacterium]NNF75872.1 Pr2TM family membrane protein [Flavobacteriaceae bacterium]NNK72034.1 Pr2TM family membrane protein [Flavobacteriaceae bacterium]
MKNIIKTIWIGFIIGLIILVVDQTLRFLSGASIAFNDRFWTLFGYYMLYSIPLSLVNSYFFGYIHGMMKWSGQPKNRVIFGFVGSVILTLFTIFLIRIFINMVLEGETYAEFINSEQLGFYAIATLITLVISLFFHALYYYRQVQKSKIAEQKVIAGTASAKFDALKNQLDPHFLFNSLNVLTSLIDENPEGAQEFTTALSKVYRYVLEQKNKELVTVDEELAFARTYVSLLKKRFEDSIVFTLPDRASNPDSKVVPMSLQLLLENAVKHNMVTSNKPLKIKIYEQNGHLVVENNIQLKQIVKKGSGVGLSNIMQRYEMLSDRKVLINKTSDKFQVSLPMLTKQIKVMRTESQPQFEDRYLRARKHVDELKEFYYSLISYMVVIPILFFIWYQFTPFTIQWFWFPLVFWGLGLIFHAYKVFVNDGVFGRNWERKKIEEYMREEDKNERWN